jgi:hypothetical protein
MTKPKLCDLHWQVTVIRGDAYQDATDVTFHETEEDAIEVARRLSERRVSAYVSQVMWHGENLRGKPVRYDVVREERRDPPKPPRRPFLWFWRARREGSK